MVDSRYIASKAPYYGIETTLVEDHSVPDIMRGIEYKHNKETRTYDKFSEQFWRGTPESTARYIFDYLKKNVHYDVESPDEQTVKSPGAIVGDRFGDCKHYASFANGVLHSLQRKGYPVGTVIYRYAGYYPGQDDLHHVFAVLKANGREYWIDPVLKTFNNRGTPYYAHKDTVIMPLKEISGVQVAGFWDDVKKGFENTKKAVTKGAANTTRAVTTGAQNTYDKAKQPVMKVAAAPQRNSFLLLLKVNAFNIAHRLYDFSHRSAANAAELNNKWKELGGDPETLKKNINEGMNAYLSRNKQSMADYNRQKGFLSGINPAANQVQHYMLYCYCFPYFLPAMSDGKTLRNSVGVDPATAAALMTAAAAIIAAMAPILKKAGWSEEDKKNAQNMANTGAAVLSYGAANTTNGGSFPTGTVFTGDGTARNMLEAQVDTTADGTKVVTVKDTGNLSSATGGGISETIKQWLDSIKSFAVENKLLVGGTIVTILVIKSGILTSSPKKGRR